MATRIKKRNGIVVTPLGSANDVRLFANNPKARELQFAQEALDNAMQKLKQEQAKPDPRPVVIKNCEEIITDKKAFLKSQKQLIADKEAFLKSQKQLIADKEAQGR